MGSSIDQALSRGVWELVRRQHGVIARRQLLELGLSAQAIQHRLDRGRLHRVERGVYAVGRPALTQRGRWMAAVLCCGSRAALSHGSAAALWGIGEEPAANTEVTVPFASPRRRAGVRVRRRPNLPDGDLTVHDGIPVTAIVRTFLDLATYLDRSRLERAINEADRIDLIDPVSLLEALDSRAGQRGVGPLRQVLGATAFRLTDSELERRFLKLVEAAGLAMPVTQVRLNGYKVDFYWPDLGLVVETDGLRYHRTPIQQARDRRRDQVQTAAGLTALRFTHRQVRFEASEVRETLRAVARRLAEGWMPKLAL
jgi:very-short-patch-repair endonuclease